MISENGWSIKGEYKLDLPETLADTERIDAFRLLLNEVVGAVHEDGIIVKGYFAWSLLDNLEWM